KIGQLVDWLSNSQPESFLSQHASNILILISVLFANILFVNIQSINGGLSVLVKLPKVLHLHETRA
ncbi:hypothetical protein ACTXQV_63745, partial [Klebsiella pneumoniae]